MTENSKTLASKSSAGTFQLNVVFNGLFVFVYGATPSTMEVYGPSCGHMYGAGFPDEEGNFVMRMRGGDMSMTMVMLENHRHCLDIQQDGKPSPADLFPDATDFQMIKTQNLWAGVRPIQTGWDLQLSLPTPLAGDVFSTGSLPLKIGKPEAVFTGSDCRDAFSGDYMSLIQVFTYHSVTSARLSGSCLEGLDESKARDGVVDLWLSAEPVFSSSHSHQQHAARALSALLGLDVVLAKPLPPLAPAVSKSAGTRFELLANAGNCMGGGYSGPKNG